MPTSTRQLAPLVPNVVVDIYYRCELYKAIDEGHISGFWTGETDTWGKLTIRVVDIWDGAEDIDRGATIYLFPREIQAVEPAEVC